MSLPKFAESPECRSGYHCKWCREKELGRNWRRNLARTFEVPVGDAPDWDCPHGKAWDSTEGAKGFITQAELRGPGLWRELHTKRDADAAWLATFSSDLPCGDCKKHWGELLKAFPPVFGDGWFAWTVEAHNRVNDRLKKPRMTVGEARARWTV
jgi:hypothetical protein